MHPSHYPTSREIRSKLLLLSANDKNGISRQAAAYAKYFQEGASMHVTSTNYLDHLAFTLASRRTSFPWRSFILVSSVDQLKDMDKRISTPTRAKSNPGLGFVFAGQGAQWAGMGRDLMVFPEFSQSLKMSEQALLSLGCSWNLREEVLRNRGSNINAPELAQPCCTALQIALVDLLRALNISASAVLGHSSGEIAAAYCIGALSRDSAIKIAYHRGAVCGALASGSLGLQGSMMSVGLSPEGLQSYLDGLSAHLEGLDLTIACINSPDSVTVSGDHRHIEALNTILDRKEIFAQKLAVNVAYHSAHMLRVADTYREAIQILEPGTASKTKPVAMFSSVSGRQLAPSELRDPDYWVRNMVSPVRFKDAMTALVASSFVQIQRKLDLAPPDSITLDMFVEISPHRSLRRPVIDTLQELHSPVRNYTSLMIKDYNATATLLSCLGEIACLGYPLRLERVNGLNTSNQRFMALPDLPNYVFDHSQKYWDESRLSAESRLGRSAKLDLLGKPVADWNPFDPRWRNHLRTSEMPWLDDHIINGVTIYPGSGMLVMAIEAANYLTKEDSEVIGFEIADVVFKMPLQISEDTEGVETQFTMHPARDSSRPLANFSEFRIFCYSNNEWQECCHGLIRAKYQTDHDDTGFDTAFPNQDEVMIYRDAASSIEQSCHTPFSDREFYSSLGKIGMVVGPAFQCLKDGHFDDQHRVHSRIGLFRWPQEQFPQPHIIHPISLDCIFHQSLAGSSNGGKKVIPTMIPTSLRRLFVSKFGFNYPDTDEIRGYSWPESKDRRGASFSGFATPATNDAFFVQFDGLKLTTVASAKEGPLSGSTEGNQFVYKIAYQPDPDLLCLYKNSVLLCKTRSMMEKHIDMLAHKNGNLRFLELDMGDSVLTQHLLRMLCMHDYDGEIIYPRYRSFTFSAGSDDIINNRKDDLDNFSLVKFVRSYMLGCASSSNQHLQEESYDIILACNPTHESDTALQNMKKLLSPAGRLLLLAESGDDSPTELYQNGNTSQSSFCSGTIDSGLQESSVFTKISSEIGGAGTTIFMIMDATSTVQADACRLLERYWTECGIAKIQFGSLKEAVAMEPGGKFIFVALLELDQPFLYDIGSQTYDSFKRLFLGATRILWVTFAGGTRAGRPEYHVIHGLTRALRHENPALNATVLALEPKNGQLSQWHLRILTTIVSEKAIDPKPWISDIEYLELDGCLQIPRVVPYPTVTHGLSIRSSSHNSGLRLIKDCPPLELTLNSVGILDSLSFTEENTHALAPLAPDEVEIRTHAMGINFRDLLIALGQILDSSMGQECAGVVIRAGADTSLQPGDRVVLAAVSAFKTVARGKVVARIPEDMPFTTAAAIPVQFGTAWEALHHMGRLERGETILIHSAAGGTGQAAIQISQLLGATVFATVGTMEKKEHLKKHYGIPDDHIFYSRDTTFVHGVKRATRGRGVDVVLNSLAGDGLLASLDCLAPSGRFIEIGRKDIHSNSNLPMYSLSKNISFIVFDGSMIRHQQPSRSCRHLQKLIDMFCRRELRSVRPLHIHDVGEVENVLRLLQMGKSMGKFVLEVTPDSQVQATLKTRPSFHMDANSTFVLAGGLGGIGRATARWMAERGARNLILLSRFGPRSNSAVEMINDLRKMGVRVETPACDVTKLSVMKATFDKLALEMPPIKGVIQMSIVARDRLFADLEYNDWKDAVNCKSLGSWNLHTILPKGMDFFILLSSASGLAGIKGQSNYDAGNTYEDAFARYRVSQGEKAIALDLGALVDDGILAEDPKLLRRVLAYGTLEPITRARYYAILDYYCNPEMPVLAPCEAQIGIGLGVGGSDGLESISYQWQPMLQPLMLLGHRRQVAAAAAGLADSKHLPSSRERLAASTCPDQGVEIVAEAVIKKLAKSLTSLQDDTCIERDRPLRLMGVDSLLAIELRNWITREFGVDIAVFETQGASTLQSLSSLVARRSHESVSNIHEGTNYQADGFSVAS
ncbi:hypothetical protein AtubIFM54640_011528 [Aspergillus tubingensis]|nr:hypothetical protein AtubIFM54640_011528 [Aspergillus tubingensis]